jgi:hypothetical protein
MRPFSRLVVIGAAVTLLTGCTKFLEEIETGRVEAEMNTRPAGVRPGLEPLLNRPAAAMPMADPKERPDLYPAAAQPFPSISLPWEDAEALLAADAAGQRFLGLKRLSQQGLIPIEEAIERRRANLGALLPLTQPKPPAAGLDRPPPSSAALEQRFNQLYDKNRGAPAARRAELGFLLDGLMPPAKAPRAPLPTPSTQADARQAAARLDRLKEAGVITRSERDDEAAALQKLMAAGGLPEMLVAELPPPPEVKPKPVKKAASTRPVGRMEGGVSGRFEVIASPPQLQAPKLASGSTVPAGLHLLSMGTAVHAEKAFEALKKEFPELAPLAFTVSKADLGDLGATYRLIAGPTDAATAERLCTAIRAKGQTCQATPFPK